MITENNALSIPELLVAFRKRYGLSQQTLAERLGYDWKAISRWENGARVKEGLRLTLKGLEHELLNERSGDSAN